MTSLPPENAPQLGTCDGTLPPHHQSSYCENWKPVAAPENQPRPTVCPTCKGAVNSCGHSQNNIYGKRLDDGSGMHMAICWECEKQAGAHPPPDERTVIPKWTKPGDWFFLESPSCTEKYSVQRRTDSGCTLVCSTPWHHQNAKRDMQNIADLHNRARTPQPVSSEKESSTWNMPATNAGPSRSPSNSCNAETTGTISAPSASESSSPNQQHTEAPLNTPDGSTWPATTGLHELIGKHSVAPSKLSAQEFWKVWQKENNALFWALSLNDAFWTFAEAYASSSNAALQRELDGWKTDFAEVVAQRDDERKWKTALEGQLREAQEQVALMDEREAEHLATVERLQEALRPLLRLAAQLLETQDEEWGSVEFDGPEIQDMLIAAGIIEEVEVTESCGEFCRCAETGFPGHCNRVTKLGQSARAALGDPKQKGGS